MDKWTELRTAYQVARLGTVSAAAEALGLHRATVNRHIDVLEAELGARVFIRHGRGYTLTDVGQDVLRVAQKTEELIEDLAGSVNGRQAQIEGEIKLTMLAPFASLLMDAISDFRMKNPQCLVNIDVGEDLARLEYGEAHIALRAGAKPSHPDYVVSSFGGIRFNLYAHDSYIARNGLPVDLGNMTGHKFVLAHLPDGRSPFAAWINDHIKSDMVAFSSRDVRVAVEAISSGVGMGFLSDHEAQMRGSLYAVLPPSSEWLVHGWLVTHVDLHRTGKVQAMLTSIKTCTPS